MRTGLPRTANDIMTLSAKDWLIYNSVITFFKVTGLWRYPVPTCGDYEFMRRMDLIYWLYKAQFPILKAAKNSDLESFFNKQMDYRWALPEGFKSEGELQISAIGDLMDHPYLPHSLNSLYEGVSDLIFGADVSMANLECVVYSEDSASFAFSPSESSAPLYYRRENFDAVKGINNRKYTFMTTANNHSLDCGEDGVNSTIRTLRAEGICFGGTNESEQDSFAATIIEKNGIKLGLICHTFGLNGKKTPEGKPWLVNRTHLTRKVGEIDFTQIENQIEYCKKNQVDLVIAQLHWGLEHEYYPRPEQVELGHHLAEMGFDVVIGHHPHVVQPMECYRTQREPERVVPIFYSLGNLITPFSDPRFRESAVARLKVVKGICRDGKTRTFVQDAHRVTVFQEMDEKNKKLRLVRRENEKSIRP